MHAGEWVPAAWRVKKQQGRTVSWPGACSKSMSKRQARQSMGNGQAMASLMLHKVKVNLTMI